MSENIDTREETTSEHIARDIREGRFPEKSARQMVPVMKRYFIQVKGFDGRMVEAETAGKARYAEYKAWREAGFGRLYTGTLPFLLFVRNHIETFHHHGRVYPALPPKITGGE